MKQLCLWVAPREGCGGLWRKEGVAEVSSIRGNDFIKALVHKLQPHCPSPDATLPRTRGGHSSSRGGGWRLEIKTILCVWGRWIGAVMFSIWAPESNNGAHSTPPRYCSAAPRLKAQRILSRHHPTLTMPLWLPACALFTKGLICGDKKSTRCWGWVCLCGGTSAAQGTNLAEKRRGETGDKWLKRWGPDEYSSVWFLVLFQTLPTSPSPEIFH